MKLCVASVVAESQPAKNNRHDPSGPLRIHSGITQRVGLDGATEF